MTTIVITATAGTTFISTADLVVGGTTVAHANINLVSNNNLYTPPVLTVNSNANTGTVTHFLSSSDGTYPIGVTHLLITTSNAVGENSTEPTYMRIFDNTGGALPSATALDVDFVDVDGTRGTIRGTLYIHSAVDTTTVLNYNVYWGKYLSDAGAM